MKIAAILETTAILKIEMANGFLRFDVIRATMRNCMILSRFKKLLHGLYLLHFALNLEKFIEIINQTNDLLFRWTFPEYLIAVAGKFIVAFMESQVFWNIGHNKISSISFRLNNFRCSPGGNTDTSVRSSSCASVCSSASAWLRTDIAVSFKLTVTVT